MGERSVVPRFFRRRQNSRVVKIPEGDELGYIYIEVVGTVSISCSNLTSYIDAVQASISIRDNYACEKIPRDLGFYALSIALLEHKETDHRIRHTVVCKESYAVPTKGVFDPILRGSFKGTIAAYLYGKEYTGSAHLQIRSISIPCRESRADPAQLSLLLSSFSVESTTIEGKICIVKKNDK